jgi:hypothetical protein
MSNSNRSIGDAFAELAEVFKASEIEKHSFADKGVVAAGARLRGKMQELKVLSQEIRTAVTTAKNLKAAAKAAGPAKGKATAKPAAKAPKAAKAGK